MKSLITAVAVVVLVGIVSFAIYQTRQSSALRAKVSELENAKLLQQNDAAQTKTPAETTPAAESRPVQAAPARGSNEILRLRGEVGRLTRENAAIGATNAISKVTANPEARKMLRDQQKLGMSVLYKGLAGSAKLSKEQAEQLNDTLADYVMSNVDRVTTALRDKPNTEELHALFDAEEAALHEKVRELLGDQGLTQFRDYSVNLLGNITAEQFKGMLSGDDAARQAKSKQLAQLINDEAKAVLTAAGLPETYQTIPMLNFRNIASEQEGERNLKLLDQIYQNVAKGGTSFLSPEDVAKFDEFRNAGVNNNRAALMLNRTVMSPISQ